MKILITGGAGFIGTNLCYELIKEHEIICVDNLLTGRYDNIKGLVDNPHFRFIPLDIQQLGNIDKVDFIFNLACPASPTMYRMHPIKTTDACYLGTKQVLEIAKQCNCPVVHASTSEIYGDPKEHPQKETYYGNVNPMGPRSCYDEGKRVAETLCYEYKEMGVDTRVVRIFNTYGPYMKLDDGRLIPNLVAQAFRNEDFTIFGGLQTRSFMYIDDLINAFTKLITCDPYAGAINLGNPNEYYEVIEVVQEIEAILNKRFDLNYMATPIDDPHCRRPDITKAQKFLNWNPTITLHDGLKRYIEYVTTNELIK